MKQAGVDKERVDKETRAHAVGTGIEALAGFTVSESNRLKPRIQQIV
jgi:hypothetical protein